MTIDNNVMGFSPSHSENQLLWVSSVTATFKGSPRTLVMGVLTQ